MRRLFFYLSVFTAGFPLSSAGQSDVSVSRREFRLAEQGFREAWEHVKRGDDLWSKKGLSYRAAFDEYIQAMAYNNSNAELNYKTGVSALLSDRKEEAAAFLTRAAELKPDVSDDVLLLAARALQFEERFSDALGMFGTYMNSQVKKSRADTAFARKCMTECSSALLVVSDTLDISIENLGDAINSSDDDYSEVFTSDGSTMFFASMRDPDGREEGKKHADLDIYTSSMNMGSWEKAGSAGNSLTTGFSETPVFLSRNNDSLFIYSGSRGEGDIMVSVQKKGEWREPEELSFPVNGSNAQTSFCISPSGNEIFFVSASGNGNIGGKDIYVTSKIKKRRWTRPANVGPQVNSPFDEESVRLGRGGDTLWFSSRGHNNIGGFDIFYSVRNNDGSWSPAQNAGYPLNTPWNELFYYPSPLGNGVSYFVSDRKGGSGRLDIYSVRINPATADTLQVPVYSPAADTTIVGTGVIAVPEGEKNETQPVNAPEQPEIKQEVPVEKPEIPVKF